MTLWNRKAKDVSPPPPPPPAKPDESERHSKVEAIVARQDFSQYNGSTYSALALLVTIPGGEREEVVTTSNSCGYSDLALCRKGDRVRVDIYRSDKAHRWAVSGSPEIVLDADQLREELKSTDE